MDKEYLRVFRAFTDANRYRVLQMLCEGELCACVLLEDLNISQPTLSHHMKILCQSGIVKSRKAGSWNYYSINEDGCGYAASLLENVARKKMNINSGDIKQIRRFKHIEYVGHIGYLGAVKRATRFLSEYKNKESIEYNNMEEKKCCRQKHKLSS